MINHILLIFIQSKDKNLTDLLVQDIMEWIVFEKEKQSVIDILFSDCCMQILIENLISLI